MDGNFATWKEILNRCFKISVIINVFIFSVALPIIILIRVFG